MGDAALFRLIGWCRRWNRRYFHGWVMVKHTIGFMVVAWLFMAGTAAAATLTVVVTNAENDGGCVSVALYNRDNAASFGSGGGYYQGQQAANVQGRAKVSFTDIPDGTYAVAAFHDMDRSGDIKKNIWGIPQEMYGFSNNYGKRPDVNRASFGVSGDTTITIQLLRY